MMEENASFLSNMKTPKGASRAYTAEISSLKIVSNLTADLEKKKKSMTAAEIAEYQAKIDNIEATGDYIAALGKELDLLERKINAEAKTTARSAARKTQSD
jgi:hypothetical protein